MYGIVEVTLGKLWVYGRRDRGGGECGTVDTAVYKYGAVTNTKLKETESDEDARGGE